jgi:hypothetical protein
MHKMNTLSTVKKTAGLWALVGSWVLIAGLAGPAWADTVDVDMTVLETGLTIVSGEKTSSVGIDQTYTLELDEDAIISVTYNPTQGLVTILNECASKKSCHLKILGNEYTIQPCKSQVVLLSTAEEGQNTPETPEKDEPENTDEGREPISSIKA